ncbi:MAG: BMP family ABC transporter substrate-binding protein [Cloacibacillus sp.]
MKKSLFVLFIALIVFAARGAEAAPKKVTLLLEGSDTSVPTSYNRLLSDGLRNAQVRFGPKKLSVSALNALSDADMLRPYMLRAASSDFVIIASAAYLKYFPEARAANPSARFVALDAETAAFDGLQKVLFREEEGGFLGGALAALMTTETKSARINPDKTIGMIMGEKTPAMDRFKKGYIQGARYIDPNVQVLCEYTGDFGDPAKGAAAAHRLRQKGVDVIFCAAGAASIGAIESAEKGGYWAIGVDTQMEGKYPEAVLASVVKLSGHVAYGIVEHFIRGTLPENDFSVGMAEDCIDISTWSRESRLNVPDDVKAKLDEIEEKLTKKLLVMKEVNYPDPK